MNNLQDKTNTSGFSVKLKNILKRITIKKVLKFIAVLLIAAVYVLLIGRMLLARNYGIMNRYVWTESSLAAYKAEPESFSVMSQQLSESIDKTGFYHISNFVYVPLTDQLQVTVRYNNSTLDVLDSHYSDRSRDGEVFVFTLVDSNGKVYDSYSYASSSNIIYNFRRLVFENVSLENIESLSLNVYYANDVTSDSPMKKSFRLYDKDVDMHESDIKIDLSSPEIDKLHTSPVFKYE